MRRPVLRHRRADEGQASVELALVLPLIVLVLLGVVHVGELVSDYIMVTHAAREGARAAAVDDDPEAAERAVRANNGLDPRRLGIETRRGDGPGSRVTVAVTYRVPDDIPLLRWLVDDVELRGEATMRVER